MKDSDFPERPDHPDYWLIAGLTTRNDQIAEQGPREGKSILDAVGATGTDHKSVMYSSIMRAMKLASEIPEERKLSKRENKVTFGAALWMDGFLVGTELARKRAEVQDLEQGLAADDDS